MEPGEDERVRVEELLGRLDLAREENDWDFSGFVLRMGFESAAKFRRACLVVTGRTMRQLERIFAREIVEYYLAAEDRELRRIARREDEFGARAREIYWGREDVPCEPFSDRWAVNLYVRSGKDVKWGGSAAHIAAIRIWTSGTLLEHRIASTSAQTVVEIARGARPRLCLRP